MQLFFMQYSPALYHVILLRIKYSPNHPVLQYPQSVFLPEPERQGFISLQKKLQICILLSLYT